jgi:Fe2+ transport system protein B
MAPQRRLLCPASAECDQSSRPQQRFPTRFLAIKLLENDDISPEAGAAASGAAHRLRTEIEASRGRLAESVIMSERHDCPMRLFEQSATVTRSKSDPRAALDSLLTHPLWGYVVLGTTLVFGVLRKELALIMLRQALGTTSVTVLSSTRIMVFTIFITFYIPCLAKLVALMKEIGRKMTALAAVYTFVIATLMGVTARLVLPLIVGK